MVNGSLHPICITSHKVQQLLHFSFSNWYILTMMIFFLSIVRNTLFHFWEPYYSALLGSNIYLCYRITLEDHIVDGVTVETVCTGPTISSSINVTRSFIFGISYQSCSEVSSVSASDAGPYTCTVSLTSSLPFLLLNNTSSVIATLKSM